MAIAVGSPVPCSFAVQPVMGPFYNRSQKHLWIRTDFVHLHRRKIPRLLQNGRDQWICRNHGSVNGLTSFSPAFTSVSALFSAFTNGFDTSILQASTSASVKLIAVCIFIVWMQKSGHLPPETPSILSQVFHTMMSSPEGNLITLPLLAVVQVLAGAICGKFACRLMYKRTDNMIAISAPKLRQTSFNTQENQPFSYIEKENSIKAQQLASKEAVITAACAFGNSLTLPLVFLSGVLPPKDLNSATGYLALFLVGWSACLWSLGYKIINSTNKEVPLLPSSDRSIFWGLLEWLKQFMNPPLYGVLLGLLIGGSPVSNLFLPFKNSQALVGTESKVKSFTSLFPTTTSGLLQPIMEGASLLGSATLAMQTIVLASSLTSSIPSVRQKVNNETLSNGSASLDGAVGSHSNIDGLGISLEPRAFWVIFLIRLLIMPLVGIILTCFCQQRRWLPPNPLLALVVLVEGAMPTAQNLVLLAQLQAGTRPLAGVLANLLMRQYILSLIPLTIWMAIFLTFVRAI